MKNDLNTIMQMIDASARIAEVLLNQKLDSKLAITRFIDNGMEPHPEKYQFMVMSNIDIDTHILELDDATKLRSQCDVVLLGSKIDDKLTFTKHVSALCTKASKQLNVFTRKSIFLSYDSSYETLLEKVWFSSCFFSKLCFILLEVIKCLKKINPQCMNNLFEVKQYNHCLRDVTRGLFH